jgi:hypothetical protein
MSKIVLHELDRKNDSIVDFSCDLDSIEKIYGGFLFGFSSSSSNTYNTTNIANSVTIGGPAENVQIQQVVGKV